jgi:hypothetical protein
VELASHATRADTLKTRSDALELDLLRLRSQQDLEIAQALREQKEEQLKIANARKEEEEEASRRALESKWQLAARRLKKQKQREILVRYFGRKRRAQRNFLRVHGGGADGKLRHLLLHTQALERQVAPLIEP